MAELAPLAIYTLAVMATVGAMLLVSHLLGERHRAPARDEPYECGVPPTGSARQPFPVRFYLVAMLFVVFDLEAVYLFAWAIAWREAGWTGFVEASVFIGVLLAALAYLWRSGALDWGPPGRLPSRRRSPVEHHAAPAARR